MPNRRPLILLYISTLFLAWSVTFGKLIGDDMTAWQKICLRSAVACPLLLGLAFVLKKKPFAVDRKDWPRLVGSGVFFGLHWTLFFISAELSTAVVAQMLVFLAPLFSVGLDALVHRKTMHKHTVVHSGIVLVGLCMPFAFQGGHDGLLKDLPMSLLIGAVASLMFSLRNLLCGSASTGGLVAKYDPLVIMAWQTATIGLVWLPSLFVAPIHASAASWTYLLLLGLVGTAIGHTMFVAGLKHFTAASATVVIALQPIWVAGYAWLTMHEPVTPGIAIGGVLVIVAVVMESKAAAGKSKEASQETDDLQAATPMKVVGVTASEG